VVQGDAELVSKAKQGDNVAFDALWARHEQPVLAFCRSCLSGAYRDPATDAADLVHETFIRALHRLDRFEERGRDSGGFRNWLFEIARRICLKHLALERRRRQLRAGGDWTTIHAAHFYFPAPAAQAEEREALRIAAREINALPDIYRAAFKLCLEDFSHREIAEMLGISVDTAMQRVHRARRLLRPRLAPLLEIALPVPAPHRRSDANAIEQALSEIVREVRIVDVKLPSGGEIQLCLGVDSRLAGQAEQIAGRRRRLARHPRAWRPFMEFADLCYNCGRWEEAREAYREVLHRNPACGSAALKLGDMLQHEGHGEEAAAVYAAALDRSPAPTVARQLAAELLRAEGRDDEAAAAFRTALERTPAERTLYYGLHRVLARLSRYEEQLANLEALRRIAPSDMFGYDEVYTPCARLRRWDIALPLLERAVEIDPNHPMALKHLFQVRMNQRRFDEESLALAERLVRLAPNFAESWSELAWIYYELGRSEESIAVLQQFIAEHPANAEAHAALAWRFHYLQRSGEAVQSAIRAYALAPHNGHVCWTLAQACTHESSGIHDEQRRRWAAEIAERFPGDVFLLDRIRSMFTERGMLREAEEIAAKLAAAQIGGAW